MDQNRKPIYFRDFLGGLTEHTFESRLGIADPPLVDYLVELLVRFVRTEAVYSTRNEVGTRVDEVADLVAEAEVRVGEAKREVNRHIGDFTLFWTGVYPEALRHLRASNRKDCFVDYLAQGKRAYRIASSIPTDKGETENEILERLSHEFETCVYGLGEVRREWERREAGNGPVSVIWIA